MIKTAIDVVLCTSLLILSLGAMAQTCLSNVSNKNPDIRYTNNDDGTVTDKQTGLMWQRCTLGLSSADCSTGAAKIYTWANALEAAQQANADERLGFSDWRLPSVAELRSLIRIACNNPAINSEAFPNTLSGYWSASSYAGLPNYAWFVIFNEGYESYGYKSNGYYVRLVRSSL